MTEKPTDRTPLGLDFPLAGQIADSSVSFLWTAVRAALLTFVVGVTLVFSFIYGWTVYNSYFALPEEVEVPAIRGLRVEEANELLARLGLRLRVAETRHTTEAPSRVVISQEPAPGRKVREGRDITAIVSMGPELIEVPDLSGRSLRDADLTLSNRLLRLGEVTFVEKFPDQPEQVLEQSPAPGEKVQKGAAVALTLNKGKAAARLTVPDWGGRYIFDLFEEVSRAGLVPGAIVWVADDWVPRGEVMKQAPPAGSQVSPSTAVEFEVSAGPRSERTFKQRRLRIEVPQGSDVQRVEVKVHSEVGTQTAYRGAHLAGDTMELWVAGWPGSEVEVFINGRLATRELL